MILIILLLTLSLNNKLKEPWEQLKYRVDVSLIIPMNFSPQYKRRLADIKLDSEGFKDLSIYLDLVNTKKEIINYGLEKSKNIFITEMKKAVNILQSQLKIKLTKNYAFEDQTIKQIGINYWDKTKIGTKCEIKT